MEKDPTPGEIVVMAGAAVAFVFSFTPFFSNDILDTNRTAWGSGLFPVATLIPIFAVIAGVFVALVRFGNVRYPSNGVLGFGWNAIVLALTFYAAVLAIAFLILDKGRGGGLGWGFWFVLIGSVATLVGAILMMNEAKTRA